MRNPYLIDGLIYKRAPGGSCNDCEAGANGHCPALPACGPYHYEVDVRATAGYCVKTGLCRTCAHAGCILLEDPCRACAEDKYAGIRRLYWEQKESEAQ